MVLEGVCSASSGIFILLLWWGRAGKHLKKKDFNSCSDEGKVEEKPILAGDCLYVGIGAIGKSTTQQQSGVFALQNVLFISVRIYQTDIQKNYIYK